MKVISVIVFASVFVDPVAGIVGGTIVNWNTKTYVAGLRQTIDPKSYDDYTYCGGVLITSTHVLTSATCTRQYPANFVAVGDHLQMGGYPDVGEQINVVKVTTHPHFDQKTNAYDIAVLKLGKPAKAKPVNLPAPNAVKTGMWISAMGWGMTSADPNGASSAELLRVSQQVVTNDACRKALNFNIQMEQLCAGGVANKSVCTGDIGGPAILENNPKTDSDDVLMGVITGGGVCGAEGAPSVYTRVPSLLGWIKQQIGTSH
ncbi:hypothetical protein PsorP6_019614 [Peronosclerospora sorghi]|nr:hypothetical protein PsorP6_019614 [Peronosclerospora sorghi]